MERKRINRLKVVLAEKGMTNKQMSEILDKDSVVFSKWVTNDAQPNVEMFIQLAKNLCVSVDDLLWTIAKKVNMLGYKHKYMDRKYFDTNDNNMTI